METLFTVYVIIGAFYALITIITIRNKDFDEFTQKEHGFAMTNLQKLIHVGSCISIWPLHFIWSFKK